MNVANRLGYNVPPYSNPDLKEKDVSGKARGRVALSDGQRGQADPLPMREYDELVAVASARLLQGFAGKVSCSKIQQPCGGMSGFADLTWEQAEQACVEVASIHDINNDAEFVDMFNQWINTHPQAATGLKQYLNENLPQLERMLAEDGAKLPKMILLDNKFRFRLKLQLLKCQVRLLRWKRKQETTTWITAQQQALGNGEDDDEVQEVRETQHVHVQPRFQEAIARIQGSIRAQAPSAAQQAGDAAVLRLQKQQLSLPAAQRRNSTVGGSHGRRQMNAANQSTGKGKRPNPIMSLPGLPQLSSIRQRGGIDTNSTASSCQSSASGQPYTVDIHAPSGNMCRCKNVDCTNSPSEIGGFCDECQSVDNADEIEDGDAEPGNTKEAAAVTHAHPNYRLKAPLGEQMKIPIAAQARGRTLSSFTDVYKATVRNVNAGVKRLGNLMGGRQPTLPSQLVKLPPTERSGAAAGGKAEAANTQVTRQQEPAQQQVQQPGTQQQVQVQMPESQDGPIELSSDDEDQHNPGDTAKTLAEAPPRRSTRIQVDNAESPKPSVIYHGLRMRYPPEGGKSAVDVTAADLDRLEDSEFLNDTIMDFYIKFIETKLLTSSNDQYFKDADHKVLRYYFFSTFFYKKLTEKSPKPSKAQGKGQGTSNDSGNDTYRDGMESQGSGSGSVPAMFEKHTARLRANWAKDKVNHERVKKWTKRVDIFSLDYIFVPIHDAVHWSLAIICHPGNIHKQDQGDTVILHLDSLPGQCHSTVPICTALRGYLLHEWMRKASEPDTVPAHWHHNNPDTAPPDFYSALVARHLSMESVPSQNNLCDCGLYVLAYIEFFCYANPDHIEYKVLEALGKKKPPALRSRADSKQTLLGLMTTAKLLAPSVPEFLTSHWFSVENGSALRDYIRHLILTYMAKELERANATDQHVYSILLQNTCEYQDNLEAGRAGVYLGPEKYAQRMQATRQERQIQEADARKTRAGSPILPARLPVGVKHHRPSLTTSPNTTTQPLQPVTLTSDDEEGDQGGDLRRGIGIQAPLQEPGLKRQRLQRIVKTTGNPSLQGHHTDDDGGDVSCGIDVLQVDDDEDDDDGDIGQSHGEAGEGFGNATVGQGVEAEDGAEDDPPHEDDELPRMPRGVMIPQVHPPVTLKPLVDHQKGNTTTDVAATYTSATAGQQESPWQQRKKQRTTPGKGDAEPCTSHPHSCQASPRLSDPADKDYVMRRSALANQQSRQEPSSEPEWAWEQQELQAHTAGSASHIPTDDSAMIDVASDCVETMVLASTDVDTQPQEGAPGETGETVEAREGMASGSGHAPGPPQQWDRSPVHVSPARGGRGSGRSKQKRRALLHQNEGQGSGHQVAATLPVLMHTGLTSVGSQRPNTHIRFNSDGEVLDEVEGDMAVQGGQAGCLPQNHQAVPAPPTTRSQRAAAAAQPPLSCAVATPQHASSIKPASSCQPVTGGHDEPVNQAETLTQDFGGITLAHQTGRGTQGAESQGFLNTAVQGSAAPIGAAVLGGTSSGILRHALGVSAGVSGMPYRTRSGAGVGGLSTAVGQQEPFLNGIRVQHLDPHHLSSTGPDAPHEQVDLTIDDEDG